MIVSIGFYSLFFVFLLSSVSVFLPLINIIFKKQIFFYKSVLSLSVLQFLLALTAFFSLGYAYLSSDFSVINVFNNSHTQTPFLYKLTGIWGNHEGSILLWLLIMTMCAAVTALFHRSMPILFKGYTLVVQSFLAALVSSFIFFTSNPFLRFSFTPLEGKDLNTLFCKYF